MALGLGRGTEVYPLAEPAEKKEVLLVCPGVHVSTAQAYRALRRSLTAPGESTKMSISQRLASALEREGLSGDWFSHCSNDFESAVFERHPELAAIKKKLRELGAKAAVMTGSGSALFGVFAEGVDVRDLLPEFLSEISLTVWFVNRARYRK